MARRLGFLASVLAVAGLLGAAPPSAAAPSADEGRAAARAPAVTPSDAAGRARLAQVRERGGAELRPRPPGLSLYGAGAFAGAAEAGAIVGENAILDTYDQPPPADPACNFPSERVGELSAGIPPCNFCESPPCN